jgi:homoserine O-acetyltransferase
MNIKIVKTKYMDIPTEGHKILLDSGKMFGPVRIAYETYGKLNTERDNAILITCGFSADAHAAGVHSADDKKPGWWNDMIGPGKAFDTNKYFVICSNVLGGCKGSTGPSSINPKTGQPYGLDFPIISIWDMVECQRHLIDYLGIDKLLCVAGGSMGGMQVLGWMTKYPTRIQSAIPIAVCVKHTPQQIALNEVGRQAIMADVNWDKGSYYGKKIPAKGLAVARMLGHITYMSNFSMSNKFGRQRKGNGKPFKFDAADFEVEHYLHYHGDNFVRRFDANSYLYLTKAMDNFDPTRGKPLQEVFAGVKAKVLVVAFSSDWLYPSSQSKEIVKACKLSGVEVSYCEINSQHGHDTFLLETKEESHLVMHFLNRVFNEKGVKSHDECSET